MAEQLSLFTFIVPKQLKDRVTDHLMAYEGISGFSIVSIQGYSKEHSEFDLAEQVRGYKSMERFEVLIEDGLLDPLRISLAQLLAPSRIRYWRTRLDEAGHLN
ncbi:DUF3240 family protein [Pseudoalteromonas piscicida]|uniref:DUF3240 domain-containing protein n=1 Tax=Pseudoalteromonas piscicida TaxID=43662 RepID=A0A2A5JV50_PSEO7|nr:DUF3240 family protein [Pseudoalteromonas piscicida]PCK33171.1 hypothetical protein CEX98_03135 [Pseudoalteromonas piscicida]